MPRRSAEDASQTRAAILAAGKDVFSELGFKAAGTQEIARRAGVTEGALFHHFSSKKALFREVVHDQQKAFDSHCRAASSSLIDRPIDVFLAGARAAFEYAGRRDYARIVMIEGPVVLGDDDWVSIDHGLGLPTLQHGLRNLAPTASEAAVRPMALMIMGAMNEIILALARENADINVDDSLAVLERLLRAWAAR